MGDPGLDAVDRLARWQLAAVRHGLLLRLSRIDPQLERLLELVGLRGELGRQPEGREDPLDVEE